jgi:hypothetical protein
VEKRITICRPTFRYRCGEELYRKEFNMTITTLVTLITEIGVLFSVIIPVIVSISKLANGTKCQLRSEMLRIYYHNREKQTIHQFEYENFVMLYEAYKALKGNSFIDKIYEDIKSWEVIS